ncbi:hypothetical protein [Salinigranum rubrum]|uniref:hypothetical protein n=1 Tax=Salinigranum rubrum TaxID=755307 RepID=UPI0013A57412|nr:hypothetical protein [Salinigranum rubrum]
MNTWNHREARALVDAFRRSGQISADTATRAYELIDGDQPVRALVLVRTAVPYVSAVG